MAQFCGRLGPQGEDNPQFRAASAQREKAQTDLMHARVMAPVGLAYHRRTVGTCRARAAIRGAAAVGSRRCVDPGCLSGLGVRAACTRSRADRGDHHVVGRTAFGRSGGARPDHRRHWRRVLAVVAATATGLARLSSTLFPGLMVLAWPLALQIVQNGPRQGVAIKSLDALGILVGEGFLPLFEVTARSWASGSSACSSDSCSPWPRSPC